MTKTMLIDAAHQEEVRVALIDNGKVEDFDFESSAKKPLRGNIYLARVTRVEPSLQAAFVEYGGNRHGFLAFNEIHPDYYQIPVSDREILQAAEAEEAALAAELDIAHRHDEADDDDFPGDRADDDGAEDENASEAAAQDDARDHSHEDALVIDASEDADETTEQQAAPAPLAAEPAPEISAPADGDEDAAEDDSADNEADAEPEQAGTAADGEKDSAESLEPESARPAAKPSKSRAALMDRYREARRKRARLLRNYKIQEVVKRRQILLVQVVKEERGTKGAALTSYVSLAGRYCVLMPNTARGGGISRKIPSASDRRRLRKVVDGLDVPKGMGLIIRTAGAKRTKAEIKRDYDYLLRLWDTIRTLTLKSIAPCLIYEEASLIKRAIRDLYDKDISKVMVDGEAGYREAKDFMKMLMPSHAKNVQPYKDKTPLFLKYEVERQLDAIYQPTVRLKSGGYIVIHQTEALVAIDVNSGKSTRERNIELTALKTNIEAAQEAARQCRLRDLAGLIVIDFIDMEEPKNNRTVERKFKDALRTDRARLQAGRISSFGLLEMSRQRRRSGIVDGTTHVCPTCAGAGVVRSHETTTLRILRAIEGEAVSGKVGVITARTSIDVALYILNNKRDWLKRIEDDNGVTIDIAADEAKAGDLYDIEKQGAPRERVEEKTVVRADQPDIVADEEAAPVAAPTEDAAGEGEEERGGRKKRRRRKRRSENAAPPEKAAAPAEDSDAAADEGVAAKEEDSDRAADSSDDDARPKRRRRRGRRGGRRNRRGGEVEAQDEHAGPVSDADAQPAADAPTAAEDATPASDDETGTAAHESLAARSDEQPPEPAQAGEPPASHEHMATERSDPVDEPEESSANGAEPEAETTPAPERAAAPEPETPATDEKSSRKGWWQRALGG